MIASSRSPLTIAVHISVLLLVALFSAWRAKRSYGDIRTALRRDLVNEGIDD